MRFPDGGILLALCSGVVSRFILICCIVVDPILRGFFRMSGSLIRSGNYNPSYDNLSILSVILDDF